MREDERFNLIDGLVYRRENNNLKFVVPESMVISILRAHHDEMTHCGTEKTVAGINQNY